MKHFNDQYNARLSYDARAGYRQAQAEGDALTGRLGPQSQILALSELYKSLRAAGDLEGAARIKAQANEIVAGVR